MQITTPDPRDDMRTRISRSWWAWGVHGAAAVAFGALAIAWPSLSLEALLNMLGVSVGVGGIAALIASLSVSDRDRRWWAMLLLAIVDLMLAVAIFAYPGGSALALLWPVAPALWALLAGILQLTAASQLRQNKPGAWLLAASGLVSLVFGVALAVLPLPGTDAVIRMVAGFSLVGGTLLLVLAVTLRRNGAQPIAPPAPVAQPEA